jgi:signal transduction histidine kinase
MTTTRTLVFGPGGVILAVEGLPSHLVDCPLATCAELPPAVRDRALALLEELRVAGGRMATATAISDGGAGPVELVAVEAMPLRRTATDLRSLLSSKLVVFPSQAEAVGIAFRTSLATDVPGILADAEKIAWCVTTLAGNALRYGQTGSRALRATAITVRTSYDAAASEVVIEVEDDGPGVPAETVSRLFRREGLIARGAGLALMVIADVVAAHGGSVDVQSRTDPASHGTTIRLRLPAR